MKLIGPCDGRPECPLLDGRLVYSAQPGSKAEDAKDDEEDEEPGR
jgi:hypothetical protein